MKTQLNGCLPYNLHGGVSADIFNNDNDECIGVFGRKKFDILVSERSF